MFKPLCTERTASAVHAEMAVGPFTLVQNSWGTQCADPWCFFLFEYAQIKPSAKDRTLPSPFVFIPAAFLFAAPLQGLIPSLKSLFFSLVLLRQRCSTHYITQIALFVIRFPPFFLLSSKHLFSFLSRHIPDKQSGLLVESTSTHRLSCSFVRPISLSKPFALGNLMRKVVSLHKTYSQIIPLNTP